MTEKIYNNNLFSPDYVRENPIIITIKSLDNKFQDIQNLELVRGSVKLRQTLCSEAYFLWGGFNASQLQFECYSDAFINNSPEGKIQLIITPTIYKNGIIQEALDSEAVALFTGYIEIAEPTSIPNHWRVTAYDRLYRVRNNNIVDWLQNFLQAHKKEGTHLTWGQIERVVATTILSLPGDESLPDSVKNLIYPDNQDISTENGVDLLRDFALLSQRFGMLDGDGRLRYIEVQDSNTGTECYVIDKYDPEQLKFSSGHVWLPKYFLTEPRTNLYYAAPDTTGDEDYYNNYYTLNNLPMIGNQDWINSQWECDEYGFPSSKYSVSAMPPSLFNESKINLISGQEYYQQDYSIRTYADPTIPMGSILHIRKNGNVIVRSYIMQRTITFLSSNVIQCDYSAKNEPYNAIVPEWAGHMRSANILANQTSAKMPFISDGTSLVKMRAIKCMTKTAYEALSEKRDDTLYFIQD